MREIQAEKAEQKVIKKLPKSQLSKRATEASLQREADHVRWINQSVTGTTYGDLLDAK